MSLKALAVTTPETNTHTLVGLERQSEELRGGTTKMINGLTEIKK